MKTLLANRCRTTMPHLMLGCAFTVLGSTALAQDGVCYSDGDIDGDDLIEVQTNFGATGAPGTQPGDCDSDGDVDGDDLIFVQTQFGNIPSTSEDAVLSAILLSNPDDSGGDIDGDDLIAVQTQFGNVGPTPLLGDYDSDGDVDGDDLIIVQSNFGAVASIAIPEPSSGMLLLLAAGVAARRRQR